MRGIPSSFLLLFFGFIILIELISFLGISLVIKSWKKKYQHYFKLIYLFLSLSFIGIIIYAFSNPELIRQSHNYTLFFAVISISFLNLFPKAIISISTLISIVIRWIGGKRPQLIVLSGSILIGTGIFIVIGYGIFWGRYDIRVERRDIYLDEFPASLDGLKIVQLSDIHLGSYGKEQKALDETNRIIDQIQPDILLFTGDIVNNFADEMIGFESGLKELNAKYGKFAITGNHDYGDYSNWPDSISKATNLNLVRSQMEAAGFRLLLNEWEQISIKDTSICIIGVENWGHKPFPQYAHLDLAMNDIPNNSFQILMTHDPAHWEAKVIPETKIPLTLSGHTHGAQSGIRLAGIEFSPMFFIQKYWGGLYKSGNQFLYVNRGLGTVGFPGRIDMRPEITVLTLHRAKIH